MTGIILPPLRGQLPEIDPALQAIATYLMEGLNAALEEIYPLSGQIAVRDTVCYDAVNPDLSRFPLLKVYRLTDAYPDFANQTTSVIAYCMTFPAVDMLPGIMRWVSKEINRLLRLWSINHSNCIPYIDPASDFKAEYRIMVNEVSQPVYAFLRFNFSFTED